MVCDAAKDVESAVHAAESKADGIEIRDGRVVVVLERPSPEVVENIEEGFSGPCRGSEPTIR